MKGKFRKISTALMAAMVGTAMTGLNAFAHDPYCPPDIDYADDTDDDTFIVNESAVEEPDNQEKIKDHAVIIQMINDYIKEHGLVDVYASEDDLSGKVAVCYYYIHPEQKNEFDKFISENNIDENEVVFLVNESAVEEPVPSSEDIPLGDVNNDGIIDASDASMVLAEYAILSTSGAKTIAEEFKTAADVNGDDVIDASDASLILAFYADISTGGSAADMREWLVKK